MTAAGIKRQELASRESDGIIVALYWSKVGDTLTLEVEDKRSCETFQLDVPKDRALDAFHHPFAYLAMVEEYEEYEPIAA